MSVTPADDVTPNGGDDEAAGEPGRVAQEGFEAAIPWRVAQSLIQLRKQLDVLAPDRSKLSDGAIGDAEHASRSSDHNPWIMDGNTGVVTAIDITDDPVGGFSAEAFSESLRAARDVRVKYVIWNRRIASSKPVGGAKPWEWRPYSGKNLHTHHVHLSVKSEKQQYDSPAVWTVKV